MIAASPRPCIGATAADFVRCVTAPTKVALTSATYAGGMAIVAVAAAPL